MESSFQAWLVCCLRGGPGPGSGKDEGSWAVWGPGGARGSKDQGLGSPGPRGLRPRCATLWVSVPDVGCGPQAVGPDSLGMGFSELTCVVSNQTRRDSVLCLLSTWCSETLELPGTLPGRVPTAQLYPQPSPGSPPPTRLQSLPQEASRKSCQKAPLPGRGGPSQVPVCLKQSHRPFKGT